MRSYLLLPGALASLTAIGCVAPPDERPDAEATSNTATAVVVVERTTGPGDAVRADAVVARFVRVHQGTVDEQALRIAGVTSDLPAVGTCSSASLDAVQPALLPRSVDLLDVGTLTVDSDPGRAIEGQPSSTTKSTVLLPRTMPDPTGVVSGVFYSARTAEAFAPAARLQLLASGGPDMPEGFRVDVPSPSDVSDVRVTSADIGLDVTWEADPSASELAYVDVLGPSSRLIARCTTVDDGELAIPASVIAAIDPDTQAQISVHRLHRESFRTKGIDPGEIRFDVARIVTFRR
jgi:hypothetical protein